MTIIMTRAQAKLADLTRYNSGVPCPKGHEPIFWVHNYSCCECARIREREKYAALRGKSGSGAVDQSKPSAPPRAKTPSPNMTPSHLRQAALHGGKLAAFKIDKRTDEERAEAQRIIAIPPVPDFEARAEERIQAARAGR